MTDERRKRIAVAVTINVIILIALLVAVVVYQLVVITAKKHYKNELVKEIERLQTETEHKQDTLDYWQSQEGLEDLYYEFLFSQK